MENKNFYISDDEFERQIQDAKKREQEFPRNEIKAIAVRFDSEQEKYIVDFANGVTFAFPFSLVPELKDTTHEQLADVRILGTGFTLEWKELDQHISIKRLIQSILLFDYPSNK